MTALRGLPRHRTSTNTSGSSRGGGGLVIARPVEEAANLEKLLEELGGAGGLPLVPTKAGQVPGRHALLVPAAHRPLKAHDRLLFQP